MVRSRARDEEARWNGTRRTLDEELREGYEAEDVHVEHRLDLLLLDVADLVDAEDEACVVHCAQFKRKRAIVLASLDLKRIGR